MPGLQEYKLKMTVEIIVHTTDGMPGAIGYAQTKIKEGLNDDKTPLDHPSSIVSSEVVSVEAGKNK
jgi:hypothetical protein